MRWIQPTSVLTGLIAVVGLSGCSGSTTSPPGAADSGIDATTDSGSGTPDGATNDVGNQPEASGDVVQGDVVATDAGQDAPIMVVDGGDGGPIGTHLQTADSLSLWGVTADGFAVYSDDNSNILYAASLTGGAAQTIVSLGLNFQVAVFADVVFAWNNLDANTNIGALTLWTSANGAKPIATASTPGADTSIAAASADSAHVVYLDNATATTADLYGAGSDGTAATKIMPSVELDDTCSPTVKFAASHAVAAYCASALAGVIDIATFAVPAWTAATIVTSAGSAQWSTDAAGDLILVFTDALGAQVFPIGGGAATSTIDPAGAFGVLTANGQTAIYGTDTAILRSSVATPSPTTLVTAVAEGIVAISPSEQTILYFENQDATTNDTDLYMASAVTSTLPVTLSGAQTAALIGSPFTVDSSHALFLTAYDSTNLLGTLDAVATSGGSPAVLAQGVHASWATSAAKIVFSANYATATGFADIESVDTATAAAPTLVVAQARADIYLSAAKDKVVYTWSATAGSMAGLYVMNAP